MTRTGMAHADLQALFETFLPFTQKLLREHGGFNPWGAVMSSSGEIQWVAADNGEEFPDAQALINMLTDTFKGQCNRGVLRAIGICYDVRIVPPGKSDKI